MTTNTDDMALTTLESVGLVVSPDLPQDLLRKAYAIQRTHQFDKDRAVSLQEMQRLVDDYIDTLQRIATAKGGAQ